MKRKKTMRRMIIIIIWVWIRQQNTHRLLHIVDKNESLYKLRRQKKNIVLFIETYFSIILLQLGLQAKKSSTVNTCSRQTRKRKFSQMNQRIDLNGTFSQCCLIHSLQERCLRNCLQKTWLFKDPYSVSDWLTCARISQTSD